MYIPLFLLFHKGVHSFNEKFVSYCFQYNWYWFVHLSFVLFFRNVVYLVYGVGIMKKKTKIVVEKGNHYIRESRPRVGTNYFSLYEKGKWWWFDNHIGSFEFYDTVVSRLNIRLAEIAAYDNFHKNENRVLSYSTMQPPSKE